ncbi:hypothetical protein [Jiella pelagia]|uniref:hypothetical protein n=1 Tax=Jiella pelagia TaxID=2986949 RepID=UPI0022A7FE89|nr:hypothetical protein [Jiella pelagia]
MAERLDDAGRFGRKVRGYIASARRNGRQGSPAIAFTTLTGQRDDKTAATTAARCLDRRDHRIHRAGHRLALAPRRLKTQAFAIFAGLEGDENASGIDEAERIGGERGSGAGDDLPAGFGKALLGLRC